MVYNIYNHLQCDQAGAMLKATAYQHYILREKRDRISGNGQEKQRPFEPAVKQSARGSDNAQSSERARTPKTQRTAAGIPL